MTRNYVRMQTLKRQKIKHSTLFLCFQFFLPLIFATPLQASLSRKI